jgi:YHS domain-containing protein
VALAQGTTAGTDVVIDPVCGMEVDPAHPAATAIHDGVTYSFCSTGCQQRFTAHPDTFSDRAHDRT